MKKQLIAVTTASAIALSAGLTTTPMTEVSAKSSVSVTKKASGTYVVKTKKNVYYQANKKKIGTVSKNTVVTLTHKRVVNGKTWYKIKYGKKTGWVLSTNLSKLTLSKTSKVSKSFKTSAKKNIYSAAGGHNKKVGTVKKNTVVKATYKRTVNGKTWYKISYGKKTGWVVGSNLKTYVKKISTSGSKLISTGSQYLGVPYVWGGTSPRGFDCSGFTQYVYKKANGKSIPRTSGAQYAASKKVSKSQLKQGDLVFFSVGSSRITHVAMYAGNGKLLHAAGNKVQYQSLVGYWDRYVVGYGTFH